MCCCGLAAIATDWLTREPAEVSLVVVIFPDAELGAIEKFRARWDPLAEAVGAHLTVVFPFPESVNVEELLSLTMRPFPVRLGNPSLWEGEHLFLTAVVGGEDIIELQRRSYDALHLSVPGEFVPHMTIGRRDLPADAYRMLAEAAELEVDGWARTLSIYRRHRDGRRTIE